MNEVQNLFAKRLHDLRRAKGWSQPKVGKLIGTSVAIMGCYERAEMMPSIEVAKKLAQTFEVTLDYLVSPNEQPNLVQNSSMMERIRAINDLSRDARAKRTYASV